MKVLVARSGLDLWQPERGCSGFLKLSEVWLQTAVILYDMRTD